MTGVERPAVLRVQRLQQWLSEQGVDAFLIHKLVNLRWLTGFDGSNGLVLVRASGLVLFTDSRYTERAAAMVERSGCGADVVITARPYRELRSLLSDGTVVGFERQDVSFQQWSGLVDDLVGCEVRSMASPCDELRKKKDITEQRLLADAASIADEALAETLPKIDVGVTEHQIVAELEYRMRLRGAEAAYPTIVASGPNSALPHAVASSRALAAGDLLVVDVGARVQGYGSDMTRTFVVGAELSAVQRRWAEAVGASQRAGVAAVEPGIAARAVDEACRVELRRHGVEELLVHGTGHGIGLEIHEQPVLSPRATTTIGQQYALTVEPGVYAAGVGGIRIEDSVLVGSDETIVLTKTPKAIVPLPS